MRKVSYSGIVDYILESIGLANRKREFGPRVVAIGGYPFTGKTTLASNVAVSWNGLSFILPTESAIMTRSARLVSRLDGSAVDSHDISELRKSIKDLRAGKKINVPVYSWVSGDFISKELSPVLGEADLLILDGSIATSQSILPDVDVAFALMPDDLDSWIDLAIARDVGERFWDREVAALQNRAKAQTVARQLATYGHGAHEHLLVVALNGGGTWAWRKSSGDECDRL